MRYLFAVLLAVFFSLTLGITAIAQKPEVQKPDAPLSEIETENVKPRPFDFRVIPKNSVGSISFRDLSELKQKFLALSKQSDGNVSAILSIVATSGEYLFRDYLGLGVSFRPRGSAVIAGFGKEQAVSLTLPVTDAADVSTAFEVDKEKLASGNLFKYEPMAFGRERWMGLKSDPTGSYLVVGPQRAVVKTQHSKGLQTELSKVAQDAFRHDDLLLTLNVAKAQAELEKGEGREVRDFMGPFFASFASLYDEHEIQRISLGLGFEQALIGKLMMEFDGDVSKGNLQRLQNNDRPCDLSGLPTGRLLFATSRSTGPESAELIRKGASLVAQELARAPDLKGSDVLSPHHFAGLIGISEHGLAHVPVSRAAVYQTATPERDGGFCLIMILDTDDGDVFMKELREFLPALNIAVDPSRKLDESLNAETIQRMVTKLGHPNERVRVLMATKLRLVGRHALRPLRAATYSEDADYREAAKKLIHDITFDMTSEQKEFLASDAVSQFKPDFRYAADFEHRAGKAVDVVQLQLKKNEEALIPQLRTALGPDWNKVRISQVNDQIVVMLGSSTDLFDQAVRNTVGGLPGIEGEEQFKRFRAEAPKQMMAEAHLSQRRAIRLNRGEDAAPEVGDKVVSSVGLSVWPQRVEVDFLVPPEEIHSGLRLIFP